MLRTKKRLIIFFSSVLTIHFCALLSMDEGEVRGIKVLGHLI